MRATEVIRPASWGVGIVVGLLWIGAAGGGILGTPHDFTSAAWSQGQACLPCHIGHGSSQGGFAWNHAVPPDAAFLKRPGASLGPASLMCLGCHDGQTALDSFGGQIGSVVMTGRAVVGRDLSDDHPVGVVYPAGNPEFHSVSAAQKDLRLYNGKVECGTCHDPHDNSRGEFLRKDTRLLCQTCHNLT